LFKGAFFWLLGRVRRASERVRSALVVGLLALVYVLVIPWFALGKRLGRGRPRGWVQRQDAAVGSIERLRQLF
jgi:hypothetical protein